MELEQELRADNLQAEISELEQWVKELEAQGESAGAENVQGQQSAGQAA